MTPCSRCTNPAAHGRYCASCRASYMREWRTNKRVKEIERLKAEIANAEKAHHPVIVLRTRLRRLILEQLRYESRKAAPARIVTRETILTRFINSIRQVFARAA